MAVFRAGKLAANSVVEAFNRTFRAECFDAHQHTLLQETQRM
jgi:hypothetical protein